MSTPTPSRYFLSCFSGCLLFLSQVAFGQLLEVGSGYPYATLEAAASEAVPGDTILIHEGTYPGGVFVGNLQGLPGAWIHIRAAEGETVIYEGGTNAWQFTDAAYLHINGFIFQHQSGNGLNFDDGGSYVTPAHHIVFEDCVFRDMNASGNNDMLKLSGVDSFVVRQCTFLNGSAGGSGIDMVGCHDSDIYENHFENQGSNSIQAKGGSSNIRIERNYFKNGGLRTLNLGGSTGLQFFRPLDAPYEAANLKVYSNIFIGTDAPVAYVGTINTEVINNTIYLPTKWVLRILQETVDPDRFPPCGYNTFSNNIIYIDDRVSVECNIGPNTAPETFTFSNNLWFHSTQPNWPGPDLPASESNAIIGQDPLFVNASQEDFHIEAESQAVGNGLTVNDPVLDFESLPFLQPRSIGAFEGGMTTSIGNEPLKSGVPLMIYPSPANDEIYIQLTSPVKDGRLYFYTTDGVIHASFLLPDAGPSTLHHVSLPATLRGLYIVKLASDSHSATTKLFVE
jgi:hypothetical protein